jgi:hypothetical protein
LLLIACEYWKENNINPDCEDPLEKGVGKLQTLLRQLGFDLAIDQDFGPGHRTGRQAIPALQPRSRRHRRPPPVGRIGGRDTVDDHAEDRGLNGIPPAASGSVGDR